MAMTGRGNWVGTATTTPDTITPGGRPPTAVEFENLDTTNDLMYNIPVVHGDTTTYDRVKPGRICQVKSPNRPITLINFKSSASTVSFTARILIGDTP